MPSLIFFLTIISSGAEVSGKCKLWCTACGIVNSTNILEINKAVCSKKPKDLEASSTSFQIPSR